MKRIFFFLLLLTLTTTAYPLSLGVVGPVYPIAEQDFLQAVEDTIKKKQADGLFENMQVNQQKQMMSTLEHPKPVSGITKTTKDRTFYYDPTVTADRTYTDGQGRIVVAAGTKVNPLDFINLSKNLIFFDARDLRQQAKAKEWLEHYEGRAKLILTAGSYMELGKKWEKDNIRLYYDQNGTLTKKLGITHVPAIVSQEGKRLRIDELEL